MRYRPGMYESSSSAQTSTSPEEAVRTYLRYLENPDMLVDDEAVRRAEAAVAEATDPIDRLLAIQHLHELRAPDAETIRDAFVTHAREWADGAGVQAQTFIEAGVSPALLREAGFSVPSGSGPERGRRAPASRVGAAHVRDAALALVGPWTIATLAETTGASMGTVRKVHQALIDAGAIVPFGLAPDWSGRGRAPMTYGRR